MNLAATLLFAFLPEAKSRVMHVCEERIFAFIAENESDGFDAALELGKEQEIDIEGDAENYRYAFVGVLELVELTLDAEIVGEVWNRYVDRKRPVERASLLIPKKEDLTIFRRFRRRTGLF